jgi:predicted nucleotidyltransferase
MTDREKTSALLSEFNREAQRLYGDRLKGVYLYGSRAHGEAEPDADVDILIILDDWSDYAEEVDRTGEIGSRLSLAYDLSISQVFVRERDWLRGKTPFLLNARQDAIPA